MPNINIDYVHNGQAHGDTASLLMASGFDPRTLRPYVGKDNRSYITANVGGNLKPVLQTNATGTLRADEWKQIDDVVLKAAQPRLTAVNDLRNRGLVYNIPNGMGKTVLQTESQSSINAASITMDGLEDTQMDRPTYTSNFMPLPIISYDFSFSLRAIEASRNTGMPLDLSMVELASEQVATTAEKLLIGSLSTFTFGSGSVYGYTNFTSRNTRTITSPAAGGWTAATAVSDVLAMIQDAIDDYHFGPYVLYYGPAWSQYMNNDHKAATSITLRQRLEAIDQLGAGNVKMLDHLSGYDLVLVQMTSSTVREVIGMDMTTVQWDTHGGLKKNYKVMAIMLPQVRADANGRCGIVHGSV